MLTGNLTTHSFLSYKGIIDRLRPLQEYLFIYTIMDIYNTVSKAQRNNTCLHLRKND